MPLLFRDYVNYDIEVIKDTLGGDTWVVNGEVICFNYVRSHYRAVKALTDGKSRVVKEIVDDVVWDLVDSGEIQVDDSDCDEKNGWLGAIVYDGEGEIIGHIGARCHNAAGYDTDHLGTGRCKWHGGAGMHARMAAVVKHGWTSKVLRGTVEKKVNEYLRDPAPMDLHAELATMRALVEMYRDYVVDKGDMETFVASIPDMLKQLANTGTLVDKMANIDQKYALTASQVFYIQATVVDVLKKYLVEPELVEEAAAELASRLGTGDRAVVIQSDRLVSVTGV